MVSALAVAKSGPRLSHSRPVGHSRPLDLPDLAFHTRPRRLTFLGLRAAGLTAVSILIMECLMYGRDLFPSGAAGCCRWSLSPADVIRSMELETKHGRFTQCQSRFSQTVCMSISQPNRRKSQKIH